MSPRKAGALATIGALIGLGVGVVGHFFPSRIGQLCAEAPDCIAATQSAHWGIPAHTWILALFLGLTWASGSLTMNRKGYTQSGKSLAVAGIATALFLAVSLGANSFTPGKLSLAGAVLVGIGGFLARQTNADPDRSIGAILAWLTLVLLTNGTIAQSKAITAPWTVLDTAPTLTGKEAVLDGSATLSPNRVLLWADFSNPLATRALAELKQFNSDHDNTFRLFYKALALNDGMPIAMGFFCAKQHGRSRVFSEKMLRTGAGLKTDSAVNALALRSQFKQAEFEACFQDESARKNLAAATKVAQDSGFEPPFAVLAEGPKGWLQLSTKPSLSAQLLAIFQMPKAGQ